MSSFSLLVMPQDGNDALNLYRIMADVKAGCHQHAVSSGEFGIVTFWVRACSISAAFARAGAVLNCRQYSFIGTLHCYAEELVHDPMAYATEAERSLERSEDWLLASYDALRQSALARADGLHEVWLGDTGHQLVGQPKRAAAA